MLPETPEKATIPSDAPYAGQEQAEDPEGRAVRKPTVGPAGERVGAVFQPPTLARCMHNPGAYLTR